MTLLLLLVLPLLVEGSLVEVPPSHGGSCRLPPASTETFDECSAVVEKTVYLQYQYRVPGLFDLGCTTVHLSQGNFPNEMHLNGSFSRIPAFPVEATIRMYGNRFNRVFHGIWNGVLSTPSNTVYCDNDIYINHFCFLGHEASQIFTRFRRPSEMLMKRIFQAVEYHPEVDKHKYVKAVC